MLLGVNIDHIAVLREARRINDPDPLDALGIVKRAGGDQITIHLREDRRHINDDDARRIIENSHLPVNLECAIDASIIDIVCGFRPHRATLVPEKREEVTTEGGLDVAGHFETLKKVIATLHQHEIEVSLFIDPTSEAIGLSAALGAQWIELHTGKYANLYAMLYGNLLKTHHSIKEYELPRVKLKKMLQEATEELIAAAKEAHQLGLKVAAGHGLNYQNVGAIANIPEIIELNIGQSIIARSVYTGLEEAILEMKRCIQ